MAPETTRAAFAASNILDLIESQFDLDTVLTGANNYYNNETATALPSVIVADFPTVAGHGKCVICIKKFGQGEGGKMISCGHVYHETCLSKWLSKSDSCPLCRRRRISAGNKAEAPETVQD